MDRVRIKETAKSLLKKNHWLCVGIGLIVAFLGYINIDLTSSSDYSAIFEENGFSVSAGTYINDIIAQTQEMAENAPLQLVLLLISIVLTCLATVFIGNQILVGAARFFLKYRKNHPVEAGELFQSYKDKTFLNVAKVTFIRDLSVGLWSMLCVIPGIIKAYEYAAVDYILAVNPTMEYTRALDLSKRIMNGHKMELFELQISFLGWEILSLFTCGLLNIFYVTPYILIAEAEFFAYVRENGIFNGVISYNDIPDYDEYIPQNPIYQNFAPNGNYYQPPVNNGYTPYTPYEPAQPVSPIEVPVEASATEPVLEETITMEPAIEEPVAEDPVTEEPITEEAVSETAEEATEAESSDEENN